MNSRRATLAAAVLTAGFLAIACKDVPFAPKWDADWTVPLPVTPIQLSSFFGPVTVPPGPPVPDTTPPQEQKLDKAVGQVLGQQMSLAILKMNYVMPLALSGADTVFVATSAADLRNPAANRVIFPIALAQTTAAGVDVIDTLPAGSAGLAMLQNAGKTNGSLWVQIRGSLHNPGPGNVTITNADVIGLSFELTARIAISR